ncbi:hypothetical protein Oscil6304_2899 [Oscillatoria acuminata PCC 6304]|uniref:Uncharacterized protein n=1 Tax=Oscillatoria acuminata PCC 6304 TaxID=56110 RepID=K9TIW6_9CYAN|nr:hypothetical protein Oscil6304_2899 [Oscillatoria acuminata PCC 6304]
MRLVLIRRWDFRILPRFAIFPGSLNFYTSIINNFLVFRTARVKIFFEGFLFLGILSIITLFSAFAEAKILNFSTFFKKITELMLVTQEHSVEPMQKLRSGSKHKSSWGHRQGFYYILIFLLSFLIQLMLWIMSGKLPRVAESSTSTVPDGSLPWRSVTPLLQPGSCVLLNL